MLSIGETSFDPSSRRLFRGQAEARLSLKATEVLMALTETPGQVWSRDALLERVWPMVHVGEEVLTHAIAELRRAFGDDFRAPRYIGTIHKHGYRLLAHVRRDEPAAGFAAMSASGGAQKNFCLRSYALYINACGLYEKGGRTNTRKAVTLHSEAIAISPGFALAHAGLAKAAAFLNTYYDAEAGLLERALQHCEAAHRLTSGSAEAYAAQGFIFAVSGRPDRSQECFTSALELDAGSAETHYLLGRACLAELEFDISAIMFERAAKLRDDDYHSLVMAGKVRQAGGDDAGARLAYAQALARIKKRRLAVGDDFRALCCEARCLWQLGLDDEAHALMDSIARHPDPMNYHLACTLARTGRNDDALNVLEQVVELGWRHRAWLSRDPDFNSLRDHPRFRRIAASLQ